MDQFSNFLNFILDLNKAVLGLQATSFTIMALAVMSMCCLVNRSNDDDDDDEACSPKGDRSWVRSPVWSNERLCMKLLFCVASPTI